MTNTRTAPEVLPREPLVGLRGITKRFPNVLANDSVDLDLFAGEVHALLGENGAGKSTLVKILYGFYRADSGQICVEGQIQRIRSPLDARRLGIGMVFQTFTLIPALTVAENIALYLPDLPAVLSRRQIVQRIASVSARYRLHIDPKAHVRKLCIGEQQKVEVLKLLLANAKVLIFDEATRVLAPHEIDGLFEVFDTLRQDGYAIVFITHKMREVLACADRITVMRRGRIAGTLRRLQASEDALVSFMFGASAPQEIKLGSVHRDENPPPLLELRGVSTRAPGGGTGLQKVDLVIRPGEIVGVAGVSGNGQRELGDVILGLLPCTEGQKLLLGMDATRWSVGRIRAHRVGFIPEDSLAMAAVPLMTVQENAALANAESYAKHGGLSLNWNRVRRDLEDSFNALGLEVPPFGIPARALSGGNLQRFVLARELCRRPQLVVALYPTRGLDVYSAMSARRLLADLRDAGGGVLLVSEDLEELYRLSDRLIVLYEGRIVGRATPEKISMTEVGHLMTGSGTKA